MTEFDDWDDEFEEAEITVKVAPTNASDKAIEKLFDTGRLRVVQDRNDFFLPHVVDFIEGRKWGNLRPEYQRRLRWSDEKKSKLIESFVMNVPVPSVFLYERSVGSFEVMDGQQRLNAIVDYLQGRFELSGLKIWPSLNGRTFQKLPPLVRRGLESAKISAITLISDTSMSPSDNLDLRAQVFERLNTGGERLNPQELRNSLYSGSFNRLILELAKLEEFTEAWDIPKYSENILSDGSSTPELRDNTLYKRMIDAEIVLRFFAFRGEKPSGSVRSMLDNVMREHRKAGEGEINQMRSDFVLTLSMALQVFGKDAFRLPGKVKKGSLSRPLFDAQMVALFRLQDEWERISTNKSKVKAAVSALSLVTAPTYDLMVGRANTAAAITERIEAVRRAIVEVL